MCARTPVCVCVCVCVPEHACVCEAGWDGAAGLVPTPSPPRHPPHRFPSCPAAPPPSFPPVQGRVGILQVHARDKRVDPALGGYRGTAVPPYRHGHDPAAASLPASAPHRTACLPFLGLNGRGRGPTVPPDVYRRCHPTCTADYQKVARATAGFTGAELMNLMNQSGGWCGGPVRVGLGCAWLARVAPCSLFPHWWQKWVARWGGGHCRGCNSVGAASSVCFDVCVSECVCVC